ncbi:MAG: NAD-dependent epimerase/dehydratase family protein [Desulfobacterales bacterium]|nr:NAD-dependent epimerase/dehydratase family protein [Desulfobacterales bacterium]
MTQALVTGGGGFLGKAIVKQLIARGDTVTSFSRNHYPELDSLGIQQIIGDLRNPAAVLTASKGMDVVFHVAAKAGVWGNAGEYHDINFHGTLHVIDACRKAGVRRLIYTSSPSVVFNGQDMAGVNESVPYASRFHAPYPASKALAEQAVRKASNQSLRTISLRPHLIWGPEDTHLVPRILSRAKQLRIVGNGQNRVDTTYIDNAANAHVLAADRLATHLALSGSVFFISQGEPVLLWDMINAILAAGGHSPITSRISYRTAWAAGALMEGMYRLFRLKGEPPMTRFVANELATSHWFDIGAAQSAIGYTPHISTQEGLQRLSQWLNPNPAKPDAGMLGCWDA